MFHVKTEKGSLPPAKQIMVPYQKALRAFSQTPIDFAGPFYTK